MPSDQNSSSEHRWSYIHGRVRDLGFPGVGEYLAQRFTHDGERVEVLAKECHVTPHTIRKYLKLYGFMVGLPRKPKPSKRKGHNLVCTTCGHAKYYSPALLEKLDSSTYRCQPCRSASFGTQ